MCEAEEDAKCLLERTVEKGLERVTHFLFFDFYRQHCSLDRSLNPFSGGKWRNTETLAFIILSVK